jgi:putative transposase
VTHHVRKEFEVSERRACRVVGQPRSTQRYPSRKADRDRPLIEKMITRSRENPRYGYRRVWALLRREGWHVNKKRVYRLWREEGLRIPDKQRKRRRLLGTGENGCTRRRAEHKDHVRNLYENVKPQIGLQRWFRRAASPTRH